MMKITLGKTGRQGKGYLTNVRHSLAQSRKGRKEIQTRAE
jgi:hypothetical protein